MSQEPTRLLEEAWGIPLTKDQPAPVPGRVAAEFEVRESDRYDDLLFDGMRLQTYEPFRDNPWVRAVIDAGMAPMHAQGTHTFTVRFDSGEVMDFDVVIERIRRGRTVVVRFQLGPFVHLWSMASAATMDAQGDNDFTAVLVEDVKRTQPQVLIAANISRLVRSDQEGGLLLKVLPDHVDEIWAGPQTMKMVGDGSEYGRMLFSLLGAMAAMERNWIVTRMMAGRVAAWRRGEWLFGETSVPFGYELVDRKLVPVPELRVRVRKMLLVLAADETPALTVKRLVDLDVPLLRPRDGRTLRDSSAARYNPRGTVDHFLAWVPLWVAGEYVWRFKSPLKGATKFAGAPVVHADGQRQGAGELQLLMRPGVPGGGWAEREVLEQVAEVARRRMRSRVTSRERDAELPLAETVRTASTDPDLHEALLGVNNDSRRPAVANPRRRGTRKVAAFSGYSWRCDDGVYELKVHSHDRYAIVRRVADVLAAGADSGEVRL